MQRRWKAVWLEEGEQQEFLFDSINNRMIARIDFRLKCPQAGIKVPEEFDLEEVPYDGRLSETEYRLS